MRTTNTRSHANPIVKPITIPLINSHINSLVVFILLICALAASAQALQITHLPATDVSVTMQSATISWSTDEHSDSLIDFGLSDGVLGLSASSDASSTSHSLTLNNLEQGTQYFYRLTSCSAPNICSSSAVLSFNTLEAADTIGSITVSDVLVTSIAKNSAQVSWSTSVPASGTVRYGLAQDQLTSEALLGGALQAQHSITLSGLLSSMTYYFQIDAMGDNEATGQSDVRSFTTLADPDDFLHVDTLPAVVSTNRVVLTGTTRPGRILVYVNREDYPAPDADIVVSGTAQSVPFETSVLLDTGRVRNGAVGYNDIELVAYDSSGKRDSEVMHVIVDTLGPSLVVNPIPEFTNESALNISGIAERGASVVVLLNGNSAQGGGDGGSIGLLDDASFSVVATLQQDVKTNVTIIASDPAGNANEQSFFVTYDTMPPTLDLGRTDFSGTHSSIFYIIGETDPGALVRVTNLGSSTDRETYERDHQREQRDTILIDPTGMIMGMHSEARAGPDGKFRVGINVMSGVNNGPGNNNLLIEAIDQAGNIRPETQSVTYQPGCFEWSLGNDAVYPSNIFTEEWHAGVIKGSVFLPIQYVGPEDIVYRPHDITITEDENRAVLNPVSGEYERDNQYLVVRTNQKRDYYDRNSKTLYVSVPVDILQTSASVDSLPDTIHSALAIEIPYQVLGQPGSDDDSYTCQIWHEVSFNVEKPENVLNWLSPKQINDTIENVIKPAKETVAKGANYATKASVYTLGACVAMQAYNFFGAALGAGATTSGGCAVNPATYWLCDRVLCPSVPPKCEDARSLGDGNFIGELPNGQSQLMTFVPVSEIDTNVFQPGNPEQGGLRDIDSQLRYIRLRDCQAQAQRTGKSLTHLVRTVNYQSTATTDPAALVQARTNGYTWDYQCGFDLDNETLSSDQSVLPPGFGSGLCYSPDCLPTGQYDKSKCISSLYGVSGAGLEPARGLISSAQCGCLPALAASLENYATILGGMQQCLEQAQIGEVQGGFCERLMAMFVCDLAIDVLEDRVLPSRETSGAQGALNIVNPADSRARFRQIQQDLKGRYGNIGNSQFGLSTTELTHKVCIAGISGDWSMIEEQFTDFVKSVDIEPVVHVDASSRSAGFDFFTGKMSITYNIFVGLIPGGEINNMQIYLECDRNYAKSGDLALTCGRNVERERLNLLQNHYERGQNVNQNFIHTIDKSVWWYNKFVISFDYKLGGEVQHYYRDYVIDRTGDLGFNCDFSLVGGITCSSPAIDENGIVEIASKSDTGVRFAPQVNAYYPGNQINVLVPMRNEYLAPFALRFTVTSPSHQKSASEYIIAPGTGMRDVVYNLPITIQGVSDIDTSSGTTIERTLRFPSVLTALEGRISPGGENSQPIDVELFSANSESAFYKCKVERSTEEAPAPSQPPSQLTPEPHNTRDLTVGEIRDVYGTIIREEIALLKQQNPIVPSERVMIGLMKQESKGNPNAVSETNVPGLYQFTTATGYQYGLCDRADCSGIDRRREERAVIRAQVKLFSDMLVFYNQFDNGELFAAVAHNRGSGIGNDDKPTKTSFYELMKQASDAGERSVSWETIRSRMQTLHDNGQEYNDFIEGINHGNAVKQFMEQYDQIAGPNPDPAVPSAPNIIVASYTDCIPYPGMPVLMQNQLPVTKVRAISQPGQTLEVQGTLPDGTPSYRESFLFTAQSAGTANTGGWQIDIEPYKIDSPGEQIIYNAQEQRRTLNFNLQSSPPASSPPAVQIIEPTGDYMPYTENIPIGINVVDPFNSVDRIAVKVQDAGARGTGNVYCSQTITLPENRVFNPHNFIAGQPEGSACDITFSDDPSAYAPQTGTFQYFRFRLDPKPGLDMTREYSITAEVSYTAGSDAPISGRVASSQRARIAFDQTGTMTTDEVMVCQGGMNDGSNVGSSAGNGAGSESATDSYASPSLPIDCLTYFPPRAVVLRAEEQGDIDSGGSGPTAGMPSLPNQGGGG